MEKTIILPFYVSVPTPEDGKLCEMTHRANQVKQITIKRYGLEGYPIKSCKLYEVRGVSQLWIFFTTNKDDVIFGGIVNFN